MSDVRRLAGGDSDQPGAAGGDDEIRLLGPIELVCDGVPVTLGGQKQVTVFALLAYDANRPYTSAELAVELWGDQPPERPTETVRVFVSKLRKAMARSSVRIETVAGGYQLTAPARQIDVTGFETLLGLGRTALAAGEPELSVGYFDQALALVRGPIGLDVESPRLARAATRLDELRIGALEDRADALLALGRAKDLVAELDALVAEHPFRERFRAQLMTALYESGRQSDALDAYRRARQLLADELGIDPSPELQALELAILNQTLERPDRQPADLDEGHTTVPLTQSTRHLATLVLADDSLHDLSGQPCVIGRSPTCCLTIDDPNLSRRHAVIRLSGGQFVLADLASTNGTAVNGVAVATHVLEEGDVIELGGSRLVFRLVT